MSTIPTTSDLADLGSRIAEDGFTAHEDAIAEIVAMGLEIEPDAPSLHVLSDTSAPYPVRVRAFAHVGYRWSAIHRRYTMQQEQFEQSLNELLEVWNHHQDLRRTTDPTDSVGALADSRSRLDALRWAVAQQRADLTLDRALVSL